MVTVPQAAPPGSESFTFAGSTAKALVRIAPRWSLGISRPRPVFRRGREASLVDQLRLILTFHLCRKIDVARKVLAALHRARLARHRIFEVRSHKDFLLRGRPAGRKSHRPLNRQTRVVVASRDRKQLEVR